MTAPSVDVIIPLFNKAPYVEQAVRSALNQTCPPRAVLVADDGSTDGGPGLVKALARNDRRVRLLESVSSATRGAAAARNRGIALAEADLVAFLDADDYWDGEKLGAQVRLLGDGSLGTVHCGTRFIDAGGAVLSEQYPPAPLKGQRLFDDVRLGRYGVTGSASAVVTRRALLEAAGPFPEGIAFGEDWDMWSRLAGLSGLAAVPRLLTNVRVLPTPSRTRARADMFIDWLRVFDRWQSDDRLMRMALSEARGMAAGHQLGMLLDPQRLFVSYPREIAGSGGALGRRLYGWREAYWTTLTTMIPLLGVRACRRIGQELRRTRPSADLRSLS